MAGSTNRKKRDSHYKKIFDSLNAAIFTHNIKTGKILDVNRKMCRMFGYTREEALKLNVGKISENKPPYTQKHAVKWIKRAAKHGPQIFEWRAKDKKGRVFWGEVNLVCVRLEGKEICLAFVRNIDRRKKAEEQLHYQAHMIGQIHDSVIATDLEGRITFWNKGAQRIFEYKSGEVMKKNVSMLYFKNQRKLINRKILAPVKRKGSYEIEIMERKKSGKPVYVHLSLSLIKDDKGLPIGIIRYSRDITERRKMEQMQRLAQLGHLVADMAHEVNNPLMIISGNAQLLMAERHIKRQLREKLETIFEQTQRAKDIIQRLLKFSRPRKEKFKISNINLNINNVVALLEHQYIVRGVKIKTKLIRDLPPVYIDEKAIQEVFMAVLTNACEAISRKGTIEVRSSRENGFVRVDIKDDGSGMSRATRKKLFEPFFTTKETGTGLGMPICQSIITDHKGEIKVSSAPGKGTTVTFFLPAHKKKRGRRNG